MRELAGVPVRELAGVPVRELAGVPVRELAGVPVREYSYIQFTKKWAPQSLYIMYAITYSV